MVVVPATETERGFTHSARRLLGTMLLTSYDHLAVGAGTESQLGMGFHVVLECELLVFVTHIGPRDQC